MHVDILVYHTLRILDISFGNEQQLSFNAKKFQILHISNRELPLVGHAKEKHDTICNLRLN